MDTTVAARQVGFSSSAIFIQTQRPREFIDITDSVLARIEGSGITEGLAVVASQHTTAAIVVNEHEPELLKDLDAFLDRVAPEHRPYAHNDVPCAPGEGPNGHAHCQALLLNTSASLPIVNGALMLGRYQRIFLVELDRARPRQVTVALLGT